jgi:hypothetical protein
MHVVRCHDNLLTSCIIISIHNAPDVPPKLQNATFCALDESTQRRESCKGQEKKTIQNVRERNLLRQKSARSNAKQSKRHDDGPHSVRLFTGDPDLAAIHIPGRPSLVLRGYRGLRTHQAVPFGLQTGASPC